jgi:hypothetical protein
LRCDAFVLSMLGFGHQFLTPTVNQKALHSSSGSLAKFTVIRRASSCVSRFGRRTVRRSGVSGIGEKRKRRGCTRNDVDGAKPAIKRGSYLGPLLASFFLIRLVVQDDVQQRVVDFQFFVVFDIINAGSTLSRANSGG